MTRAQIELPPKLIPVFAGKKRYRCAYGGRGSGKTRSFALMTAVRGYQCGQAGLNGAILCGREFVNSLADSSLEEVKEAIRSVPWLANYYEIGDKYIRSRDRRINYLFAGLRYNLDSLKSKARILLAWADEAESVSEMAWQKLLPTVREHDSEVWVTWNPETEGSPTDLRFRKHIGDNGISVEVNYCDNPWFPEVLEQERLADKARLDEASYRWIWEGAYLQMSDAQIFRGKYEEKAFTPGEGWNGPYFGLDFGFSQDPTAAVKCWVYDGCLYIERDYGKIGLELDDTAPMLRQHLPGIEKYVVRADSARPESISYLKRHGLPRITGAQKGKGSVEDGIEFIKSFKRVFIHPDAAATLREFKLYSYKTDRLSGDVLPVVLDENNHCIAEGELVHTDCGLVPVEQITAGHNVLTRAGFKPVVKAWQSGINQPILLIRTDSCALRCTGNHQVWTDKGFVRADSLKIGDTVLTDRIDSRWLRLLNLTARFTADTQTVAGAATGFISSVLSRVGRCGFTGKSGSQHTAKSQKDSISTIKTATPVTTAWTTWNVSARRNIYLDTLLSFMPMLTISAEYVSIWKRYVLLLKHGTAAGRGWLNIVKSARRLTSISSRNRNHANNVENLFCLKPLAAATCFALANARLHGAGQVGWMTWSAFVQYVGQFLNETNTPELLLARERVQTVTAAGTANRVFDIEVCGQHEFFASGILVHNCIDAVRYALEPLMKRRGEISRRDFLL